MWRRYCILIIRDISIITHSAVTRYDVGRSQLRDDIISVGAPNRFPSSRDSPELSSRALHPSSPPELSQVCLNETTLHSAILGSRSNACQAQCNANISSLTRPDIPASHVTRSPPSRKIDRPSSFSIYKSSHFCVTCMCRIFDNLRPRGNWRVTPWR